MPRSNPIRKDAILRRDLISWGDSRILVQNVSPAQTVVSYDIFTDFFLLLSRASAFAMKVLMNPLA